MYADVFANLQVPQKLKTKIGLKIFLILLVDSMFTLTDSLHFLNSQQVLNFTYDLTQPPDGQWGAIQPDGTWSGLVGMLMREEIDIGK